MNDENLKKPLMNLLDLQQSIPSAYGGKERESSLSVLHSLQPTRLDPAWINEPFIRGSDPARLACIFLHHDLIELLGKLHNKITLEIFLERRLEILKVVFTQQHQVNPCSGSPQTVESPGESVYTALRPGQWNLGLSALFPDLCFSVHTGL